MADPLESFSEFPQPPREQPHEEVEEQRGAAARKNQEGTMLKERVETRKPAPLGVWETIQEARRVASAFQPEGATPLNLQPVHFKGAQRERALTVALTVGTTIGTGHDGVLLVPERTRAILKQMNLPFRILETAGQHAD